MIRKPEDTGSEYHVPVLLRQSVDGLITNPDGVYADMTFGGGGHSAEILKRLTQNGKLFAFDQDEDALANKIPDERLTLINSNFRFFENHLKFYKALPLDGILADLGVSSYQFDKASRGFSIRFSEPLDMRMNKATKVDAQIVLNEYDETRLADVLYQYGELRNSRVLANRIVKAREASPIKTPDDIRTALKGTLRPNQEKSALVQLFQAVRIEVNDELGALKVLLEASERVIKKGGKLVIISYHSLEDRLVKNYLRSGNFIGNISKDIYGNVELPFKSVQAKPITPDKEETERNPRSRSAKLRIAIKT